MIDKSFILFAFISTISNTASAESSQANQANQDIIHCQLKAAIELDDGISDVRTLAPIIAGWCKKESDRFFQILRNEINGPIDEPVAQKAIQAKDLEMAGRVLLMKRSEERKSKIQQ